MKSFSLGTGVTRTKKALGVLLIGHGSRRGAANREFEALVDRYRQRQAGRTVAHAYLELATPSLDDAISTIAAQAERVVLAPLLLFAAGHVKNDIPLAIERAMRRFPQTEWRAAGALGVHPALADLAFRRVGAAAAGEDRGKIALLAVGRGSSDPDANGDFCKLVRLVSEGRGFSSVTSCFVGITEPRFDAALDFVSRTRPEHIIILPYFLFGGRLVSALRDKADRFARNHPWIRVVTAAPLGADDALLQVMDERIDAAVHGGAQLPCTTCHYRVPIGGIANNVGGLRALLWSVRHMVTHSQAMPHEHAHGALTKHVLVCGNADCAERGSLALLAELRQELRTRPLHGLIRVTRTACMGRCGEGPTVAVYPDGVWYRGVRCSDAADIVNQHLLGDQIVARLVDNIMQ